ncbi:hypothetical protein F52700_3749 [Fusarium sp. NRRL 52700]|nr:hypothetical protein F52700_3749 [Fusarium sp. NRRL 52700]
MADPSQTPSVLCPAAMQRSWMSKEAIFYTLVLTTSNGIAAIVSRLPEVEFQAWMLMPPDSCKAKVKDKQCYEPRHENSQYCQEHSQEFQCAININTVRPRENARATLFGIPRKSQRSSVRTIPNASSYTAATALPKEIRDSVLSMNTYAPRLDAPTLRTDMVTPTPRNAIDILVKEVTVQKSSRTGIQTLISAKLMHAPTLHVLGSCRAPRERGSPFPGLCTNHVDEMLEQQQQHYHHTASPSRATSRSGSRTSSHDSRRIPRGHRYQQYQYPTYQDPGQASEAGRRYESYDNADDHYLRIPRSRWYDWQI